MTGNWTAAAWQLAEAAGDLGTAAADAVASAWSARVLPEATRSLVQAAGALTGGEALPRIWAKAARCPSATEFLGTAEELEGDAAALARRGRDLAASCESALSAAVTARQAARRAMAIPAQAQAATEGAAMAERVIAECEAALDLVAQVLGRLRFALGCFRRVPEDFAEAYDMPLEFVRAGGTLPWSGDFLTAGSPETAAGRA